MKRLNSKGENGFDKISNLKPKKNILNELQSLSKLIKRNIKVLNLDTVELEPDYVVPNNFDPKESKNRLITEFFDESSNLSNKGNYDQHSLTVINPCELQQEINESSQNDLKSQGAFTKATDSL